MRGGQLRDRVEIFRKSVGNDGVTTLTSLGLFWARVQDLSGKEEMFDTQVQASCSLKITIRYTRLNFTPADIIKLDRYNSDFSTDVSLGRRVLAIDSISDTDNRHKELVIMCSEVL